MQSHNLISAKPAAIRTSTTTTPPSDLRIVPYRGPFNCPITLCEVEYGIKFNDDPNWYELDAAYHWIVGQHKNTSPANRNIWHTVLNTWQFDTTEKPLAMYLTIIMQIRKIKEVLQAIREEQERSRHFIETFRYNFEAMNLNYHYNAAFGMNSSYPYVPPRFSFRHQDNLAFNNYLIPNVIFIGENFLQYAMTISTSLSSIMYTYSSSQLALESESGSLPFNMVASNIFTAGLAIGAITRILQRTSETWRNYSAAQQNSASEEKSALTVAEEKTENNLFRNFYNNVRAASNFLFNPSQPNEDLIIPEPPLLRNQDFDIEFKRPDSHFSTRSRSGPNL